MATSKSKTNIEVSAEFHGWLSSRARKGETYEEAIKRLLGRSRR